MVPEGTGWSYPPFSGTISDNKIYGRGAIDDKGPVIASLYAMKAVMDNCKINGRVRLILGLNEEQDWKCINYYKEHEEMPNISFSPDADFPCIYAEKSILSCYLKTDISKRKNLPIEIKSIDCNNNALNVVPKFCSTILKINPNEILMCELITVIKNFVDKYNFEIDIYKIDETEIKLTSHGVQAHAAHPDLGTNAISQLIIILNDIFKTYNVNIELFDFFTQKIGIDYYGSKLDINFKDSSGMLTLNVGKFELSDSFISIGMNLRIPISIDVETIKNSFLKNVTEYPEIKFLQTNYMPSLYVSKDDYLVKTLCDIFNLETNSNEEPIAIGGATFARAFENCISFGPNFPGDKDKCHQTDEFIDIDKLILSCKIYAKAIIELSK